MLENCEKFLGASGASFHEFSIRKPRRLTKIESVPLMLVCINSLSSIKHSKISTVLWLQQVWHRMALKTLNFHQASESLEISWIALKNLEMAQIPVKYCWAARAATPHPAAPLTANYKDNKLIILKNSIQLQQESQSDDEYAAIFVLNNFDFPAIIFWNWLKMGWKSEN